MGLLVGMGGEDWWRSVWVGGRCLEGIWRWEEFLGGLWRVYIEVEGFVGECWKVTS